MKKLSAKKIAVMGMFLALALIVSLIESLIPPIIPVLPYAKIGLTNVILLLCFLMLGTWEGFTVLVLKCLFMAIFAGNFGMMLWSLPSGAAAYVVMILLYKTKFFSIVGLSCVGAVIHNTVQILIATLVIGRSVFVYLPYMLLAGIGAGFVTGVLCHYVYETTKKLKLFEFDPAPRPTSKVVGEGGADDDADDSAEGTID